MNLFKGRTVVEIMILCFTFTVAFSIIVIGTAVIVAEIVTPDVDTSRATDAVLSLITGILGALLGLIAGKNEATLAPRPTEQPTPRRRTTKAAKPPLESDSPVA